MHEETERPNVDSVLNGLMDFQRNTVEYVFQRLYEDNGSGRFLVADEVGLGKTLVARGLIAKTIDYLWDKQESHKPLRIDIVYICSNADIAQQNINRLRMPGEGHFAMSTRITMLPTQIHDLEKNRVNFVSLTPNTSFNLRSNLGRAEERALLYWLLDQVWGLKGAGPLNVLEGTMDKDRFRSLVNDYRQFQKKGFDASIIQSFTAAINRRIESNKIEEKADIRQRFEDLCFAFRRSRKHIPLSEQQRRRRIIGELRELLAVACVTTLEPDLIILDEFQRFKHLLEGTDQASWLARGLFEYPGAKTVLLSATPYKMYTLTDESGVDDHYQDFLRTTEFLFNGQSQTSDFRQAISTYRRELFRLGDTNSHKSLIEAKQKLESLLQQVMVRTEKLAATADHSGMLADMQNGRSYESAPIKSSDLKAYVTLQKIAHQLKEHSMMEYWKSSPYLLNFMDNYKFKRKFSNKLTGEEQDKKLVDLLVQSESLLLSRDMIESYQKVDPNNARLRYMITDTIEKDVWKLLWLPPALPYYQLEGPFAKESISNFTKRLVFSSWQIVPKAVTSLLSYEAERNMLAHEEGPVNTPAARNSRARLLQFRRSLDQQNNEERLDSMSLFTLLYPSITLAQTCDPLKYFAQNNLHRLQSVASIEEEIGHAIAKLLQPLNLPEPGQGRADESWYWAAPMLLDLYYYPKETELWWEANKLAETWKGGTLDGEEKDESSLWSEHVTQAKTILQGFRPTGWPPPDLIQVLAKMSIASPSIVAARSLSRVVRGEAQLGTQLLRANAGSIAWAFLSLFNVPEVNSLVRGIYGYEEPYWRRVMEYAVDGNLQSVMDEYTHVLRDAMGLLNRPIEVTLNTLATEMRSSIQLRPASLKVDDISFSKDGSHIELQDKNFPSYRLRTHFALRFGDQQSDDDPTLTRKKSVREAFNSPFWPFVLVSTSVGQEGLDFHLYCHAIVHWNLPSNPVDLEQREGRVHRYKGHAIRKNLAEHFGSMVKQNPFPDPWQNMFDKARENSRTDLVPYWIFPENGQAKAKIERHVPIIPLSRDVERLENLRRALTVYRIVFGQNRQEDLTAYLLDRLSEEEIINLTKDLQINLEPPRMKS